MQNFNLEGHGGRLRAKRWDHPNPRYVALLCHGYGEHIDRYDELAGVLNDDGAQVYGLDHLGHGLSEGDRVVVKDFDAVVNDFHLLAEVARREHPGLPQVLIGHSMGGLIAGRYIQKYGQELKAAVLSGPLIGTAGLIDYLMSLPELPDEPLDPSLLSRDQSVGERYANDPLMWHGMFKQVTLDAMKRGVDQLHQGGRFGIPVLYLHGEDDQLVNYPGTVEAWNKLKGDVNSAKSYPEARHEIFGEINKQEVFGDMLGWLHQQL